MFWNNSLIVFTKCLFQLVRIGIVWNIIIVVPWKIYELILDIKIVYLVQMHSILFGNANNRWSRSDVDKHAYLFGIYNVVLNEGLNILVTALLKLTEPTPYGTVSMYIIT